MNKLTFAKRNIVDKLNKVIGSWPTFKFYWRTYILSKIKKMEADIYMVSYPKCGRTWLRIMIQRYLELTGYTPKLFHDNAIVDLYGEQLFKFEHDHGNWVPAPKKIKEIKINHDKYKNKKVIFLVRDPRDVLVSSWYHLKYRENIFKGSLHDFIHHDLTGIHKVIYFFNLWVNYGKKLDDFLLLTYEDLHKNPNKVMKEMFNFIGISPNEEKLFQSIEASQFDNMKKMESKGSLNEPWMKPGVKNLDKSMKIRKGKVGSYNDELDEKDVNWVNKVMHESMDPSLKKLYLS